MAQRLEAERMVRARAVQQRGIEFALAQAGRCYILPSHQNHTHCQLCLNRNQAPSKENPTREAQPFHNESKFEGDTPVAQHASLRARSLVGFHRNQTWRSGARGSVVLRRGGQSRQGANSGTVLLHIKFRNLNQESVPAGLLAAAAAVF